MSDTGEVRETKGSEEPWNRGKVVNRNVRPPRSHLAGTHPPPHENGLENVQSQSHLSKFENIIQKSNLNANAQVFVPRQQMIPQLPSAEDMSYLKEAIEVLTMNPGRYQEFLPPIEDIVENVIGDSAAVCHIIDVIIEQCITEQNFRYTGARLCRDFAQKFNNIFIMCLLNKCHERFNQLQTLLEVRRDRAFGFGMVLAELFLQVTVDDQHLSALATGLHDLLGMLLRIPGYDAVRTVCQILKLTGVPLENSGFSTQPIFLALKELSESSSVDENSRRIIAGLMHLRRTEWSTPEPVASNHPVVEHCNEPVFYSPDGQIMSEEERSFLLDNIPISEDLDDYIIDNDEMDDEANAAFDEFVTYSQNNHPGYRG